MRLVTFQDDSKRLRVGALAGNEKIVDLTAACALYLREVENETAYYPLAGALVPADMRAFFARRRSQPGHGTSSIALCDGEAAAGHGACGRTRLLRT